MDELKLVQLAFILSWHQFKKSAHDCGGIICLLRKTENADLLVHRPSPGFSSITLCLLEIRRLYPSSPQTALKRVGCHTANHSTHFACPLANFPLQFRSTWQAFLQKTFKRILSFPASIPFTSSVLKNHLELKCKQAFTAERYPPKKK